MFTNTFISQAKNVFIFKVYNMFNFFRFELCMILLTNVNFSTILQCVRVFLDGLM